jgi:hypothetical protein
VEGYNAQSCVSAGLEVVVDASFLDSAAAGSRTRRREY